MYHVELRQFPHNAARYNLTEPELRALVQPWSEDKWVEFGERKWNPNQARMTIVQGPEIPLGELSMGRGWRIAQREGEDVTDRVLAAAKAGVEAPAAQQPQAAARAEAGSQQLQRELTSLLGGQAQALFEAWRHASALYANRSPSECLALAEKALASSSEG